MFQAILALLAGSVAVIGGMSSGGSSGSGGGRSSNSDDDSGPAQAPALASAPVADPPEPPADVVLAPAEVIVPAAPAAPASPAPADLGDAAYTLSWAGLTAEEQLIVELVNRARLDPLAEVDRLSEPLASGIPNAPVQPLAVTPELSAAARGHSEDMDDRDFFAHTNPSGQSPGARAVEEGHGSASVGENIGWIGSSRVPSGDALQARAEAHHTNLWESDGHQRNLMSAGHSEIGVGYDYGDYRGLDGSTFVTEMFADRGQAYLTGVVIKDGDSDDFYDLGEGVGGVRVTASDGTDSYGTSTWEAGGYALALPPGTYRVTFEGGGLEDIYEQVVAIGNDNVKLDVIEDDLGAFALTSAATVPDAVIADVSNFLPEVPLQDFAAEMEPEEDLDLVLI